MSFTLNFITFYRVKHLFIKMKYLKSVSQNYAS